MIYLRYGDVCFCLLYKAPAINAINSAIIIPTTMTMSTAIHETSPPFQASCR